MKRRRRVRSLRWAGLKALRVLKRHHLSFVSAAVLAVALAAALTNADYRSNETPGLPERQVANRQAVIAEVRTQRPAVYYLADATGQIALQISALRGEMEYSRANRHLQPAPSAHFLLFETRQQEADGARFLTQLAEMASFEGFQMRVVDLRQE